MTAGHYHRSAGADQDARVPLTMGLPAIVRVARDAVRATQLIDSPAGIGFVQDGENLLFGESTPSHGSLLWDVRRVTF